MRPVGDCPSDSLLARVLEGDLSRPEHAAVMRHVADCPGCRDLMSAVQGLSMSSTAPGIAHPEAPQPRGTVLGRYVLLERIGAGAVGVVYAAYDPELDRKVALKLLSSRAAASPDGSWRERMLREARAMAAVRHPNVLTIHDVGQHDDGVFIAMELIEGSTLTHWMTEAHTIGEVLWVFRAAGRGLSAAHERGLVHRDFKPDNILLGNDGRVLVSDFGLARFSTQPESCSVDLDAIELSNLVETRTGAMVGTPAYMAPEQFAGEIADARSDQFSFCVTLYEALYGVRPFRQETLAQMREAIREQTMEPGEPLGRVPARVRGALAKGLSYDPSERHASVEALLAELDGRSMRRWVGPSLAAAGVLVGAVATNLLAPAAKADRSCEDLGRIVDATWDDGRRSSLERLYGTEAGTDGWKRLSGRIDSYAQRWKQVKVEACHAEQAVELPAATIASRDVCLYRIQLGFRMLLDELEREGEHTVYGALDAVTRLPSPTRCADLDASLAPPAFAAESSSVELEETLARAGAAWTLGHRDHWRELSEQALDLAEREGDDAGRIRAHINLALDWTVGDTAVSESHLRDAISLAVQSGDHALAAESWVSLSFVLIHGRRSITEAKLALDMAESEASHVADNDGNLLNRLQNRSGLAVLEGRYGDALALIESQEQVNERFGDPITAMSILDQRASLAHQRGQASEAVEASEEVVALLLQLLGPKSPDVQAARINLGLSYLGLGRNDKALQTLNLVEVGKMRPTRRAVVEFSRGDAYYGLEQYTDALDRYDEALALLESIEQPPAHRVIEIRLRRYSALVRLERLDDAENELSLAQPLVSESGSPLFELDLLAARGGLALENKRWAEARSLLEQAEAGFAKVDGEDGFTVAAIRCQLGRLELAQGRPQRAREYLLRSMAILDDAGGPDIRDCRQALEQTR